MGQTAPRRSMRECFGVHSDLIIFAQHQRSGRPRVDLALGLNVLTLGLNVLAAFGAFMFVGAIVLGVL